jgi:hypothetical protein
LKLMVELEESPFKFLEEYILELCSEKVSYIILAPHIPIHFPSLRYVVFHEYFSCSFSIRRGCFTWL